MRKMKQRLDEQTIALRVAKEFQDGFYVNLGLGIGELAAEFIPEGKTVIFHTESGVIGFGAIATPGEIDWNIINAGANPLTPKPGMCFCDSVEAFNMIRGRHLDLTVLGALQVSEKGDLANHTLPGMWEKNIGGAMDLGLGAKKVIVAMTHTNKKNEPKIVKKCTLPLTRKECVNLIVTDIAVIEVTKDGLLLKEIAPGFSPEEVQALTGPQLMISSDLKEMEL
jgi:3-oxoacid CoA-transferase B subunit